MMLSNRFCHLWIAGAFAFVLLATGIGDSQTKPAAPTIIVYQDPT
jgi:hypothetical protein